jgi:hypothetical protein
VRRVAEARRRQEALVRRLERRFRRSRRTARRLHESARRHQHEVLDEAVRAEVRARRRFVRIRDSRTVASDVKLKTPEEAEAIVDELQAIDFHHRSDRFEVHGYDSVDSEGVDVSIVPVGDDECTITYTVQGMGFDMRWEEDTGDGPRVFRKNVTERVELSGTAKISFTEGANEVSEVSLLTLDQKTFALSEAPFGWW